MRKFIRENLRYPEEALKNGIEGVVAVKYEVDQNGNVIHAAVKNGIGYGCDEEALRLVRLLKFGKVRHRGLRVTFHKTINIRFSLPGSRSAEEPPTQLVYTYVEKKNDAASYTYTISPR